jgi:hypothetical protein
MTEQEEAVQRARACRAEVVGREEQVTLLSKARRRLQPYGRSCGDEIEGEVEMELATQRERGSGGWPYLKLKRPNSI